VPTELRAWHAGVSTYKGREKCNDFSIGIELEGADDVPFAEPQYETLAKLLDALTDRYGELPLAGHSEIAPGRKTDPGPWFEWERVRA
jgi:N-acetyl-anhydromuramoyl-L-alanine amidase